MCTVEALYTYFKLFDGLQNIAAIIAMIALIHLWGLLAIAAYLFTIFLL